MSSFPARLHVVSAEDTPISVIFRRGPSKNVCTILWDRSTDAFSVGQWMKGRIYERRSDISPDGKYLIYFAMNGKWDSETKGSWTAISKAPYLKAIALFAKGDCWNGGGLFTGKRKYWLNDGYGHEELLRTSEVNRDDTFKPETYFGGECTGVYYPRLLRNGWHLTKREEQEKWNSESVFEKPLSDGWILRKIAHEQLYSPPGKGCYWDEHELVHEASGEIVKKPDWEWADLDGKFLIWAEKGALFRAIISGTAGLGSPQLLRSFTDISFEPTEAPY